MDIDKVVSAAIAKNASDIHVQVGESLVFRIHGELHRLDTGVISHDDVKSFLMGFVNNDSLVNELTEAGQVDLGIQLQVGGEQRSFRVNAFKEAKGMAVAVRVIPNKLQTPEQIGLPSVVTDLIRRPQGLILVTGPTGSGKSTTLASLLNWINLHESKRIITVESPMEFPFRNEKSFFVRREVPVQVRSCASALQGMLRQDPDIIMVGELRRDEEFEIAMLAAETGHLVLSTVHTRSAKDTVNRIVDEFDGPQQSRIRAALASSLLGIVSQRLVPRVDGEGRVMACEVLVNNPAVGNLIREGRFERLDTTIQTGKGYGMQLFDDHLFQLICEGKVSFENALSVARSPDELAIRIAKRNRDLQSDAG